MASLEAVMTKANLGQYTAALQKLGAAQVGDLLDVEDSDLAGLGMMPLEIRRLRRKVSEQGYMMMKGAEPVYAVGATPSLCVPSAPDPTMMIQQPQEAIAVVANPTMAAVTTGGVDQAMMQRQDRQDRQDRLDRQDRQDHMDRQERAERADKSAAAERSQQLAMGHQQTNHSTTAQAMQSQHGVTTQAIAHSAPVMQQQPKVMQLPQVAVAPSGEFGGGLFNCMDDMTSCLCVSLGCGLCLAGQTHERASLKSGPCWKIPLLSICCGSCWCGFAGSIASCIVSAACPSYCQPR